MGKDWQNERKNDEYYQRAKEEGYRSRSAYKLEQLDEKYELIERGDVVLDLGAAPGGWLQIIHEKIGDEGFLLGVDIEEIEELEWRNIKTVQADITEMEAEDTILENLPEKPDIIVSDAAPDISGIWDVDQAKSIELGRAAMNIARRILKPGGNVLIKVFQGDLFEDFRKDVKECFEFQKSSKPKASRDQSSEIYVIGKGFVPPKKSS